MEKTDTFTKQQIIYAIDKHAQTTFEEGTVIPYRDFLKELGIKTKEIPQNTEMLKEYDDRNC